MQALGPCTDTCNVHRPAQPRSVADYDSTVEQDRRVTYLCFQDSAIVSDGCTEEAQHTHTVRVGHVCTHENTLKKHCGTHTALRYACCTAVRMWHGCLEPCWPPCRPRIHTLLAGLGWKCMHAIKQASRNHACAHTHSHVLSCVSRSGLHCGGRSNPNHHSRCNETGMQVGRFSRPELERVLATWVALTAEIIPIS